MSEGLMDRKWRIMVHTFFAGVRNPIDVAMQLAKDSRKGTLPLGRTPPVCGTNFSISLVVYGVASYDRKILHCYESDKNMRFSSRLYRYTSNSDLSLHYYERNNSFDLFFLYHLQLAAIFTVLFCGEHDSFLAGDGAREWASRRGLTTGAVGGEVEKVRDGFQCSCYNQIIIRMLNFNCVINDVYWGRIATVFRMWRVWSVTK